MFANSFGYRFIYRKNKLLTIADNNIQYRYQELFYFTIKRPDNQITVQIIKPWGTKNIMMIWKGELQHLKKYIIFDGIDFNSELTKYLQQGITAFAFAMRTIDEEDAELLIKQINEY